jgi:hypothetical protein
MTDAGLIPVAVLDRRALVHGGRVYLAGEYVYVPATDAQTLADAGIVRLTVAEQSTRARTKRPSRTKASS